MQNVRMQSEVFVLRFAFYTFLYGVVKRSVGHYAGAVRDVLCENCCSLLQLLNIRAVTAGTVGRWSCGSIRS